MVPTPGEIRAVLFAVNLAVEEPAPPMEQTPPPPLDDSPGGWTSPVRVCSRFGAFFFLYQSFRRRKSLKRKRYSHLWRLFPPLQVDPAGTVIILLVDPLIPAADYIVKMADKKVFSPPVRS